MIAIASTWITTALLLGAGLLFLAELPGHYWSRPCKWCFYVAIGLIIAALGFPGWYFLFIVGV